MSIIKKVDKIDLKIPNTNYNTLGNNRNNTIPLNKGKTEGITETMIIEAPIPKPKPPFPDQDPTIVREYSNENLEIQSKNMDESFDYEECQKKFNEYMQNYSDKGTRDKTVAATIFLTTQVPKMPYFRGGGHYHSNDASELKGIQTSWNGKKSRYGTLDCSGLVSWSLVNGGYPLKKIMLADQLKNLGKNYKLGNKEAINKVKEGDLVWTSGHIGIVVKTNKEQNEIVVAHESGSGSGMNLTTINTESNTITKDSIGSTGNNRTGKKNYFKNIVSIEYPDEK